jgi:hypothetical protein
MSNTVISGNDALKQHITDEPITENMFQDRPLLGLCPKYPKLGGADVTSRAMPIPIASAYTNATSGNFTVGQAAGLRNASRINAFQLTSTQLWSFVQLEDEAMKRSMSDEDSFVDFLTFEFDGLVTSLSNRIHQLMYGNGTGVIAVVGNAAQEPSFSTATVYVSNPEDMVHIEVNDELIFSSSTTSAKRALGSNGTGVIVGAVDRDNGFFIAVNTSGTTVNVNDATYGCPNIANGDVIFHRGDTNTVVDPVSGNPNGVIMGCEGWNPFIPPTTSDSFFNVNRGLGDIQRLAGTRMDATSYGIEEALVRGANKNAKVGGKITEYFVPWKKFSDLVGSIHAKTVYEPFQVGPEDADVGYEAVKIIGGKGSINVVPDYACPSNRTVGLNLSKVKLCSVGELVQNVNGDGNDFLRVNNANNYEIRYVTYVNFASWNPLDHHVNQHAI